MKIPIVSITISPNRQRTQMSQEGLDGLAVSMNARGQLHPILVVRETDAPDKYRLVAGYRRLQAALKLKWDEIEAKELQQATQLELEEIELDENLQRENLTWQEEVNAKKRLLEIRQKLYGESVKDVASHVQMSHGSLWEDAQLARAMTIVPDLAKSKNKTQAIKKLRGIQRRANLIAKQRTGEKPTEDISTRVLHGSAIEVMKGMPDASVHLVCTDPPYGINLDVAETKKGNLHPTVYEDDHYDIMDLVALTAKEAYRVLVPDSHAYFFFDIKAYTPMLRMLTDAGFSVDPVPLVWVKNIAGQTNHPDSRWGSAYEACFFARKGSRALLKQGQANALIHDVVPSQKKIHPVEKPASLLRQLIEASTVPGEIVLDPFGGSGSTAEAAAQLGRDFITIEKDPAYWQGIVERIQKLKGVTIEAVEVEVDEDEEEDWEKAFDAKGV